MVHLQKMRDEELRTTPAAVNQKDIVICPGGQWTEAKVMDGCYFALRQKVAKLESANTRLTLELRDAKEDACIRCALLMPSLSR